MGILLAAALILAGALPPPVGPSKPSPFSDYRGQSPGRTHLIRPADLPAPSEAESADNEARLVPRPKDAWPQAPAGFKVEAYATALNNPRLIRVAPNGDVFVAESRAHRVR